MILIAYGTRYGSTEECFDIMMPLLKEDVKIINLSNSKETINIDDYQKVIIGSSVNAGRIQKAVKKFVNENLKLLLNKKVGLFITSLDPPEKAVNYFNSNFPIELVEKALVKKCFGGALYYERLNPIERPILKMITKSSENIRNFNEENIKEFAKQMNK